MKLSTAINTAPAVFAYVQMGDETTPLKVSKKNAKEIARTWLDDEWLGEEWHDDESGMIIATINDNTGNVSLGS